jgi:hypothetical protein
MDTDLVAEKEEEGWLKDHGNPHAELPHSAAFWRDWISGDGKTGLEMWENVPVEIAIGLGIALRRK